MDLFANQGGQDLTTESSCSYLQQPILDIMYEYSIPSAESLLFVEKIRSTSREGNITCWPPVAELISDG